MKLSKAQQEVVDKMREGATLLFNYHNDNWDLMCNGSRITIKYTTGKSLKQKGIIESIEGSKDYRLTEQYKNKQDER